jgi:hypothetical protein
LGDGLKRGPLNRRGEHEDAEGGYIEEQILQALRQAEGGEKLVEICRKIAISERRGCTRSWD